MGDIEYKCQTCKQTIPRANLCRAALTQRLNHRRYIPASGGLRPYTLDCGPVRKTFR